MPTTILQLPLLIFDSRTPLNLQLMTADYSFVLVILLPPDRRLVHFLFLLQVAYNNFLVICTVLIDIGTDSVRTVYCISLHLFYMLLSDSSSFGVLQLHFKRK